VELYYFDGEQCPGGAARDVRVQFFCDPDAGAGRPLDYYVLEEDCHYSITCAPAPCPAKDSAGSCRTRQHKIAEMMSRARWPPALPPLSRADLACARDADHTCIGSWPSQYGCPVSDGGGGWGWLHSLAVLFIVYLGFGTALNMARCAPAQPSNPPPPPPPSSSSSSSSSSSMLFPRAGPGSLRAGGDGR